MYSLAEFINMTDVENYLENYVDVAGFLECCRKCDCYGRVWSCPPHNFDPEEYWKKYKYIYILGRKIIFDQAITSKKLKKEDLEKYVRQVFLKEKLILFEKMLTLEKEYPGGIGLSAGECRICRNCTRPGGKACLYPEEMRYSIESLGGNVVKTAKELLEIELKWTEGKLPDYMTLVTGFLSNDPGVEI